jgi:Citrate transporter
VIEEISRAATDATEGRLFFATMVLLWGSAALSAVIDNIPYVATTSPVVAEMVNANGDTDQSQVLWWALALGADLACPTYGCATSRWPEPRRRMPWRTRRARLQQRPKPPCSRRSLDLDGLLLDDLVQVELAAWCAR